jgi:5'-phosphate synthase pdxT subunit
MVVGTIGILALQGDFAAHAAVMEALGAEPLEIRRCGELDRLDGLILPGGESTTLLNLMADEPWFDALRAYHASGGCLMGTCAGSILLSREILNPLQPGLGILDATVERNGFGRQVDSFEARVPAPELGGDMHAVFIRAPRFRALGEGVRVLASLEGEPVLVRQGRVLAATFHPELTADSRLHRYFMEITDECRAGGILNPFHRGGPHHGAGQREDGEVTCRST